MCFLAAGSLHVEWKSAVQIIPSRDVKVAGLLGPASPVDKKGVSVAETTVGLGGTTQWSV
jgi:protein transport protein SEC23